MKKQLASIAAAIGVSMFAAASASATTIRMTFNYMATNLTGDFSGASGGTAVPVADLVITDHGDLGIANPGGGAGGVRATFRLRQNGLSQFSNGLGNIFISAFELNFPETSECVDLPACANAEDANGYSSDANGGLGNNWADAGGVPLAGGVEWAENGANNGWGAGLNDPSFGQEYNWGNAGGMNQSTGFSVIDIFSADGRDDISVANLLANPVHNTDPNLPDAYAWIKVRSNNSADPAARGIATNQWWGTPQTSGQGDNQRWQLNVLATDVQVVPEPALLSLLVPMLGGLAWSRRRTRG